MLFNLYCATIILVQPIHMVCIDAHTRLLVSRLLTFIFMSDDYDDDVDDAALAGNENSHEQTSYCAKREVRHKLFWFRKVVKFYHRSGGTSMRVGVCMYTSACTAAGTGVVKSSIHVYFKLILYYIIYRDYTAECAHETADILNGVCW